MIGKTMLHYRIIEELGRGGMGVVYLAEDLRLDRQVAIKFLPAKIADDNDARQRFQTEAKAAAALNHPNIAHVYAIEEVDDLLFIVMEYVPGRELKTIIAEAGTGTDDAESSGQPQYLETYLSIPEVVDIVSEAADALQVAHEKGVIHRDIKSANIMISESGEVKIMDFGLAKVRGGTSLTQVGTTMGTIAYMSPEQARGQEVDERSDIWSLGVILYELLTGELPFRGDYDQAIVYSILNDEPQPPSQFDGSIPAEFDEIISSALSKEKDDRYSSMTEFREALNKKAADLPAFQVLQSNRTVSMKALFLPLLLIVLLLTILYFVTQSDGGTHRAEWARMQAIPEIIDKIDQESFNEAFALAKEAEKYMPDDPILKQQWPKIAWQFAINSDPPGADIFYKPYDQPENEWIPFGKTPMDSIRFPKGFYRWQLRKDGFQTVTFSASEGKDIYGKLNKPGEIPNDMVRVISVSSRFRISGLNHLKRYSLPDFFIDKYEVTNQQFKAFIESGGYDREEYWQYPFLKDGREISRDAALREFTDATGRRGPATWEAGNYPEGAAQLPVSGVSWYEAAAYAAYAGKTLPSVYHWNTAAGGGRSFDLYTAARSNFNNKGLSAVGESEAIGSTGAYDLAGNVREWCLNSNASDISSRYILGGAWSDPAYAFSHADARSPFDRSPGNGFRCIKEITPDSVPANISQPITPAARRDFSLEKPLPRETVRTYKDLFTYEKTPLNAQTEWSDDSHPFWIKEKISFDSPLKGERMFIYLFLPKNVNPPYQVVTMLPGSRSIYMPSSENGDNLNSFDGVDFVIKNGRALLYPVLISMHERMDGFDFYTPDLQVDDLNEHIFSWVKEFSRSIDYLETRPDIDTTKMAYYGSSWGTWVGSIFLALDRRVKVNIWRLTGLITDELPSFVDPLNYLPEITIPTLLLNGKYDYVFPYKTSQLPMMKFLGSAEKDKKLVHFPVAHSILRPRQQAIRETLDWLDHYLGPVQK